MFFWNYAGIEISGLMMDSNSAHDYSALDSMMNRRNAPYACLRQTSSFHQEASLSKCEPAEFVNNAFLKQQR